MSPKNIAICVVATLVVLGATKMAAGSIPFVATARSYFI